MGKERRWRRLKRDTDTENPGLGAKVNRININKKTKFVWTIKEENLNLEEVEIDPKEIIKEDPL